MANKKDITVTSFITRGGARIKRDELTQEERCRLAYEWNNAAMQAAGFTVTQKADIQIAV